MQRYVVVGGGVAGVCCAEELCRQRPEASVTLVSASGVLKGITTVSRITKNIEEYKIEDRQAGDLTYPNLQVVQAAARGIDLDRKELLLEGRGPLPYDRLCIAAGAAPRSVAAESPHVLTLRDTHSVRQLAAALSGARRVLVVGNGGIALELIHALRGREVVWSLKHGHIGDAFFDLDAAEYLLGELQRTQRAEQVQQAEQWGPQRVEHQNAPQAALGAPSGQPDSAAVAATAGGGRPTPGGQQPRGAAVGPQWAAALPPASGLTHVTLEYGTTVASVEDTAHGAACQRAGGPTGPSHCPAPGGDTAEAEAATPRWPVAATLSNGKRYGVDLVVAAVGVTPALAWVPPEVERAADGGLRVDTSMRTSAAGVYAAGDSCTADWPRQHCPHWFQMRLWSQAKAQGVHAARCMAEAPDAAASEFAFEMFAHATRFLGKKVVLLGLYNGQRLEGEPAEDLVSYCRATEGPDGTFARVLLLRGRVQGAVLIGDTGLEEALSNLILDQLDVGQYGPALLDPDLALEDIFD